MEVTDLQKRVAKVLMNMHMMTLNNEDDAQMFASILEDALNMLQGEDAFGTEGQNDPRGDFRDGAWSMDNVQGME